MVKLPERAWLPLSNAADLIRKRYECPVETAREALFGALRDGQVYARGTRPNPVYERAKASGFPGGVGLGLDWGRTFPPQVGRNLNSRFFLSHDPDWQTNTVGEVTDVEVDRASLLRWLGEDDAARMGLSSAYPEPETGQHPQETAPTPQENDERPELKQDKDQPPDSEQGQLSRRDQQKAQTKAKRERWYQTALKIKSERKDDEPLRPIEIAKLVAKKEKAATNTKVNPESIKRRLNEHYKDWAG